MVRDQRKPAAGGVRRRVHQDVRRGRGVRVPRGELPRAQAGGVLGRLEPRHQGHVRFQLVGRDCQDCTFYARFHLAFFSRGRGGAFQDINCFYFLFACLPACLLA